MIPLEARSRSKKKHLAGADSVPLPSTDTPSTSKIGQIPKLILAFGDKGQLFTQNWADDMNCRDDPNTMFGNQKKQKRYVMLVQSELNALLKV